MTEFKVTQAEKSFKSGKVLTSIDFTNKTGNILGIFGRNGCGKSTLLKIIFGTLRPDKFEAFLNNKKYNPTLNIKKQQIAYLPQHHFLPPEKKVRNIVSMFYGNPHNLDKVLYNPKIAGFDNKKFYQLSGGEKRYLEIMLIARLPHKVMILDEPFSMIDPIEQELISDLLFKLRQDKNIIITDHYYRNVLKITDNNILISDGKSYKVDSINELREKGYLK